MEYGNSWIWAYGGDASKADREIELGDRKSQHYTHAK